MPDDLTNGYKGDGRGNTRVLDDILARPAGTWRGPAGILARELFEKNFMPYARAHRAYDGSACNCEHLARAFLATWNEFGASNWVTCAQGKDLTARFGHRRSGDLDGTM